MQHMIIYGEPGRFAGWCANNGIWTWDGQEIVVGFTVGGFAEQKGHNIVPPYINMLARSTDGGDTWAAEQPARFVGTGGTVRALPAPLNLAQPGFAVRMVGTGYHGSEQPQGCFYYTYDRGRSWDGPIAFNGLANEAELQGKEITCRTDYLIASADAGMFFMSAREPGNWANEKVFIARTTDGCITYQFAAWVVPQSDPYRAVMPNTVRCGTDRLVTVVRRREMAADRCWIDCYASSDNGQSWAFRSKVADTGAQNGNPPALTRLRDGRLCCVSGNRAQRRIEARMSADEGATWSDPIILREDFHTDAFGDADLGYPRVVQRSDGKLMAFFYWATAEQPQQHIAATIWVADAAG